MPCPPGAPGLTVLVRVQGNTGTQSALWDQQVPRDVCLSGCVAVVCLRRYKLVWVTWELPGLGQSVWGGGWWWGVLGLNTHQVLTRVLGKYAWCVDR